MSEQPQIHLSRGTAGCSLSGRLEATAVMIDALRASTTLAALCVRGVGRIAVVADVEDARALAARTPGALLIGERGGERLPGFDFGNSPLEILAAPELAGRTAIFTSSNGAQRLAACLDAARAYVGSTANASLLAAQVRREAEDEGRAVVLIAAGMYPDEAFISPEDEATAAYLATRIGLPVAPDSAPAFAHWDAKIQRQGLPAIFHASRHAERLIGIGYADDVAFCAQIDTCPALPVVTGPALLDGRQVGVEVRKA